MDGSGLLEVPLRSRIPPTGWIQTLAVFGAAGLLLFIATHALIPVISESTGLEAVLVWFLIGGLSVLAPLVIVGLGILKGEWRFGSSSRLGARLRFCRMSRGDWLWGVGATVVVGVLTAGIQAGLGVLPGEVDLHPGFMAFEPLTRGRYWILVAWLPFWVLNIMGEEFLWRGVLLPRQEVALGRNAWVANGIGWLVFHFAFGWQIMMMLLPILIVLPYAVQRRRNTWVGVVIHAGVNGPGFIAIAFGLV